MLCNEHIRHLSRGADRQSFRSQPAQLPFGVDTLIERDILKSPCRGGAVFFEQIRRDAAKCRILIAGAADLARPADKVAGRQARSGADQVNRVTCSAVSSAVARQPFAIRAALAIAAFTCPPIKIGGLGDRSGRWIVTSSNC